MTMEQSQEPSVTGQGLHGMILQNGKYTIFNAPSPPKAMRAAALSNTDTVRRHLHGCER